MSIKKGGGERNTNTWTKKPWGQHNLKLKLGIHPIFHVNQEEIANKKIRKQYEIQRLKILYIYTLQKWTWLHGNLMQKFVWEN